MINYIVLFFILSFACADEFPEDSLVLRLNNEMFLDNFISQPE